tara:strand:+ start:671 stop:1192 length:522 start_codon:yes stop_codon:yes gene_type:complete
MREYKSVGYDFTLIVIWLFSLCVIMNRVPDDVFFNFITEHLYYAIFSLIIVILFSINVIKVNRTGIIKEIYILPFKIKRKTWREIKFYAEVDEIYSGKYGDETKKAIWFLDKNDKVCLRVRRANRENLNEVLKIVDKFEDKFKNKIKIRNPYFMKRGWTKTTKHFLVNNNSET